MPVSPTIPLWLQAAFWGLLAGSALLIGAAIGWVVPLSQRVVAAGFLAAFVLSKMSSR